MCQSEERSESLEKTPLRAFNLNAQNFDGKKENLDKLLSELKCYLKTKEDPSKGKPKGSGENAFRLSHESDLSGGPVLIRPLATNAKDFNRKPEMDESKSDQKYSQFKNPKIQKKLMENVFQPIQRDKLDKLSVAEVNANAISGKSDGFDNILFSKNDKTIHESLRMSKTKRRKSLPSFDEPKDSLESLSNIDTENSKSYNISYYTSITKGKQSDTGSNEYYSSSLNSGKTKNRKDESEKPEVYPHKSVSDDYVYGANKSTKRDFKKLPTSISTDSIKQDCEYDTYRLNRYLPKRISVTEPSSPASAYTGKYAGSSKILKMKNENTESDVTESESECNTTPVVTKVRKSKSFVEQKATKKGHDVYNSSVVPLQAKPPKGSKVKVRKLSRSSTSSCDSFCPSQSLRRNQKVKVNRAEIENTKPLRKYESNSLNHPPKNSKKKRACACEESDQKATEKGRFREGFAKGDDARTAVRKPPEIRERSAGRDAKNRELPSSSRMNAEMYLHLLDALLQKNQKDYPPQAFTKSLPRNHKSKNDRYPDRHREFPHQLTTVKCDKDCLKILKSVAKPEPNQNRGKQKNVGDYMDFTGKKKPQNPDFPKFKDKKFIESAESTSGRRMEPTARCGCSPYACYNAFCNQRRKYLKTDAPTDVGKHKADAAITRGDKMATNRSRGKNQRGNDEECVIRIEDEKLWIKICKAVEEVNFKEKNLRKSD